MHSARVAEWILGLVTTRDRAASTIGDLTERETDRGALWFWRSVFGTVGACLWRAIAEHPARLAGLAVLGIVVYAGIGLLFAFLDGVVGFTAVYLYGNQLQLHSLEWRIWFAAPVISSSLLIGRMLARWAPGRELAACTVYAALVTIYNLASLLGNNDGVTAVMCLLIVPAGAAWGRHHRHSSTLPTRP